MSKSIATLSACAGLALAATALGGPAHAQYRDEIANDPGKCSSGAGPAVAVTLTGVRDNVGTIRVQSYRATKQDWLEKGRWINRIEAPARAGTMRFCMPVPVSGRYAIAVRHDVDGDGKTDIFGDGGAMSNNPSINLFNLGKPSYKKVGFDVGRGVESITIRMRYR